MAPRSVAAAGVLGIARLALAVHSTLRTRERALPLFLSLYNSSGTFPQRRNARFKGILLLAREVDALIEAAFFCVNLGQQFP
jgi:hypothetical protein